MPLMTASRTKGSLLDALSHGGLVLDGAMSTALYERGVLYTQCFDYVCVTQPDLVTQVHESYVRAGTDVLSTNSFGANRYRLKVHGLEQEVVRINRAAVVLARAAAGEGLFVAGSIGPTGLAWRAMSSTDLEGVRAAFVEQCAALLDAGVDGLLLETFRQPGELQIALEAVRKARDARAGSAQRALPIIASVSFDPFGTMADGTGPEAMAENLAAWGADAIGVNCADGPAGVYEMASRMLAAGMPVIAQPNAGLPQRVEGRFAYMATPEYFQLYARRLYKAGIKGVGGCCGTTFEHIRKIKAAARMASASAGDELGGGMRDEEAARVVMVGGVVARGPVASGVSITPREQKSELGMKLGKQFVVSVEVNPPPGLSIKKSLEGARMLRDAGVDVINVADGPRASARMGNLALCLRVQQELGMPALMHVTTRDRNLLGLVAHLLAAHELGVRNLVVITGDPPKMGDFPDATPVYDLDSIGLLRLLDALNRGLDPGGKPLGEATSFLCATGAEPAAHDYSRELERLRAKVFAGAELVMTQPVYDVDVLLSFLEDIKPLNVPVLVGLLPLASHRNAEFLHNEVPGMRVPDAIRERMRKAGQGPSARAEGIAIAREMLSAVKDHVAGAYVMPPFGRYESAIEIIQGIVR